MAPVCSPSLLMEFMPFPLGPECRTGKKETEGCKSTQSTKQCTTRKPLAWNDGAESAYFTCLIICERASIEKTQPTAPRRGIQLRQNCKSESANTYRILLKEQGILLTGKPPARKVGRKVVPFSQMSKKDPSPDYARHGRPTPWALFSRNRAAYLNRFNITMVQM